MLFVLNNLNVSKNLSSLTCELSAGSLDKNYSIMPVFEKRPEISSTEPFAFQNDVMRTNPIKIRFSKEINSELISPDLYNKFINVTRRDSADSIETEDVFGKYFNTPEVSADGYQIIISPINKLDESLWM